ncbi:HNH endonuclease, partial [Chloroflexota bacterium]
VSGGQVNYRCQVCGTRLEGPAGPYAEAAHIRPLGRPHNGPDMASNVLCLCPNHHVLFDLRAFAIVDDLTLLRHQGHLAVHPTHQLDMGHIRYHRQLAGAG